jgi:hypothetical protein
MSKENNAQSCSRRRRIASARFGTVSPSELQSLKRSWKFDHRDEMCNDHFVLEE